MTKTERKRFWSRVDKGPECWEWTGALTNNKKGLGYGRINLKGSYHLAHRISYRMKHGAIPNGLCICHTCDNRLCVRPSHLFIGTHKDNMIDCCTKGRIANGSRSATSKLTETQVKAIQKDTRLHKEIAKDYGVDNSIISKIKTRKIWKHVR